MIYLSKEQIILLHERLIEAFGGSSGVRSENILDLCVNSIHQTFDGIDLYPSIIHKAVHLGFSLVTNHAFIDGNKRIGTHAMLVMLALNGYELDYSNSELIDIIMSIASSTKSEDDLLKWVKEHLQLNSTF